VRIRTTGPREMCPRDLTTPHPNRSDAKRIKRNRGRRLASDTLDHGCIRVDRRPLNFRAGVRTRSTAGADDLVTGPASLVQWLLGIAPILWVPKADPSLWHRANVTQPPEIGHITPTHAVGARRSGDARSAVASPQRQLGPTETCRLLRYTTNLRIALPIPFDIGRVPTYD
jgi:hypothetical protein